MVAGFQKAVLLQSIPVFRQCLDAGLDHSAEDAIGRTPLFGLRYCHGASTKDFVCILRAFIVAGADINHIDMLGNTLLLMTENDNLGTALVQVGAIISYDVDHYRKRALANAAVYGCTRTIDAIVASRWGLPDQIHQRDFDLCLDMASKILAYNPNMHDMSGVIKLIVDYGADPNTWRTLHYSVRSNRVLVKTLISLGARTDTLAWDFSSGVNNTPLHRIMGIVTYDVFEALVQPNTDMNIRDGSGATPLMAMMKVMSLPYPDHDIITRMGWLIDRGASFLPKDYMGKRISDMARSEDAPFKNFISAKIKDENWLKRREMVLSRHRFIRGIRKKRSRHGTPGLTGRVVGHPIEGIFRHIVTFL